MAYWTEFTLQSGEHCTHKYLGELTIADASAIYAILAKYFSHGCSIGKLLFNKECFFGPVGTTRVLLASCIAEIEIKKFSVLRASLDPFRNDDYKIYRPHVTTRKRVLYDRVAGYALMNGADELVYWCKNG